MEEDRRRNVERALQLAEQDDWQGLCRVSASLHPADVAQVLERLEEKGKVRLLKSMDKERAAEVLSELDEKSGQALLELLSDREVVSILEEMPSDDAADIISYLPPEKGAQIEAMLPAADRERLERLLEFEEDSAGGIMEAERLALDKKATIADAVRLVRESAEEIENVQKIYVLDEDGVLVGTVAVLDLLLYDPGTKLSEVMETNIVTVPVDMDQEQVAALFAKYDEFTLPVVDEKGRLLGRITVDDIIDVMEEEASEDIAHIVGTDEAEIGETSPVRISRSRLPWLIAAMLGEVLNAVLMSRYEVSLNTAVTLAFFIPLLIGTAGNMGSQAAVVVVRELALGEISLHHTWRRIWKELQVALINGFVLGAILFTIVNLWRHEPGLGALLWVSLLSVITVAALMGASMPLILHRLNIDPAVATGPFISVSNDILGLAIYLSLATVYLSMVKG